LSQAYGVSRAAEARPFALGEFPLLDAVLLEMACWLAPYGRNCRFRPGARSLGRPGCSEAEISTIPGNAACLLIAFPLSVKGKVLGVFLVEEHSLRLAKALAAPIANRRLREKR